MKFRFFAATTATALVLGGAAFGQTMIGDQEVSAGDLAAVTAHCAMLAQGSATADVEPGNTGNPGTTGLEESPEATEFGSDENEDVVPGNTGNADAADNMNAAAAPATDELAPDANAGNPEAETTTLSVNLQQITLAECEAAGF
ncbi:hypothetical protein [Paracoccus salsus]|uniref:hypothetical protein n=1 Tax=Paracoccus salsus TaxID=2911061 RepID=UPI001F1D37D3|nr:hypothetical protein [Paracoccus salsus]MCF3972548.1 hypothetical protein [Paracoccus salsus]